MTNHRVVWDHSYCDHAEDDCSARGDITCDATQAAEPHADCRWFCDGCEVFRLCETPSGCDYCHRDAPSPVTFPHCAQGHALVWHDHCNYQAWLTDDDVTETGPVDLPGIRQDGLIEATWEGDYYTWDYASEAVSS